MTDESQNSVTPSVTPRDTVTGVSRYKKTRDLSSQKMTNMAVDFTRNANKKQDLPASVTGVSRIEPSEKTSRFTPLSVLDEMIRQGWGDIPQTKIPPNWRKYKLPKRQQVRAAILAAEK